jgi:putative PIN family toxin of toxin-antitoxin system
VASPSIQASVVIDTNVWISGLIFGGNPEKVLRLFIDGRVAAVISEELLSELRRKIVERLPFFQPKLALLEASIRERAIIVKLGLNPIEISRDPKDNMVLETAASGEADYIISGDKDLLVLGSYKGIVILKPTEFIKIVTPESDS